jgi:O-antigen ligase
MPLSPLPTLRRLLVVVAIAFPWLCPWTWGPDSDMVQRLVSAVCAAMVVVAFWGPSVALTRHDLARCVAGAWLMAALLSCAAALLQYFGVNASPWVTSSEAGVAFANLRQRNQFASLSTLGLAALLYFLQTGGLPARWSWRYSGSVLAMALLALGNAASSSRTGLLQWMAIAVMAWVWSRNRDTHMLRWCAAALAAYLACMLLLPNLLQWHSGLDAASALARLQEHSGCGSRTVLWGNVAELIAQKPRLGWGWGELKFAHFITPYSGTRFCEILDNAHNLPLHLAFTLGLPLALLLCVLVLAATLRSRPWQETEPARQMAWMALAAIGLHSLLEYPLWYGPFQMAAALCLLLLWGRKLPQVLAMASAGLALTIAAYATWDYHRVGQLYLLPSERAAAYRENTLEKVRNSWLYQDEVRFAYVTTTPVTQDNAADVYPAALLALHYSPEPQVVAALLESARLLGRDTPLIRHIRAQSPDESTP